MCNILALLYTLSFGFDGGGDVAIVLALEQLGDAVGIVMIVLIATLLHVVEVIGKDVGC